MQLTITWQEFIPIERMNILKDLIGDFETDNKTANIPDYLSIVEKEAALFLCDPTRAVAFHIFDRTFGKTLLQVHIEFWNFYFEGE